MRAELVWVLSLVTLLGGLGGGCAPTPPAAPAVPTPPPVPGAAVPSAPSAAGPAELAAMNAAPDLPTRPDRPVAKVTIGTLGSTADVVFFLAEERGYFERMRIEPVFERFDSTAGQIPALATNQIAVGGGSPGVGLYNALARGIHVRIVADRASSAPGRSAWHLFVRKELIESGALRDFSDLRGRRIAVSGRGGTAEQLIARALEKGNLATADIDIVEMPYPDMAVAMANAVIDVAIAPEPFVSVAIQRGGALRWMGSQDIMPNQVAAVIMYAGQFVEQRPAIARDFMVAYLLGARDYEDAYGKRQTAMMAEVRETIVRRTELRDLDLLDRVEPAYVNPDGRLDRSALTADYQWFRDQGMVDGAVDVDQFVDDSYARYAVSVLGPYP
jgi:NitT/TauT family transport system substrate-binding protein